MHHGPALAAPVQSRNRLILETVTDMTIHCNTRALRRAALALAAILFLAPPLHGQEPIVVTGMATPESAVHDPEADVYLVSNINGGPGDVDDNGFITRLSPDGTVTHLKWIDGEDPEVTLHAPKGSAVHGDRFYVADIDTVRSFDRTTGAPLDAWVVPGAGFLNDLAVGADGTVYVTDTGISIGPQGFTPTGTAAVYRFDADGQPEAIAEGDALALPNGVVEAPQGLVLAPDRLERRIHHRRGREPHDPGRVAAGAARRRGRGRGRLAAGLEHRRQRRLPDRPGRRRLRDHLGHAGGRHRDRRGPQPGAESRSSTTPSSSSTRSPSTDLRVDRPPRRAAAALPPMRRRGRALLLTRCSEDDQRVATHPCLDSFRAGSRCRRGAR